MPDLIQPRIPTYLHDSNSMNPCHGVIVSARNYPRDERLCPGNTTGKKLTCEFMVTYIKLLLSPSCCANSLQIIEFDALTRAKNVVDCGAQAQSKPPDANAIFTTERN